MWKKIFKVTAWIAAIIVIFGINKLVYATYPLMASKEVTHEETSSSKYPNINLTTITKQTKSYTFSISKPSTNSENINSKIDEWIDKKKDTFIKEVEDNKKLFRKNPQADLNIQVETHRITKNIYSLVFHTYEYSGGANGINTIKVFNIDLKHDRFLNIHDVLNINKENMKDFQKNILEVLQKNKEIEPYIFPEKLKILAQPEKWEWSINQKTFTLFFDEYEIAAGAAGAIEIKLPIEKIQDYLQENFQAFLKIPKKEEPLKGMVTQEEHKKLNKDGKYVALTFDDGPSKKVTPQVLQVLKEHNAKATFFMLGTQVDYYPDLALEIAEEGHEIGNHSKSHPNLRNMGIQQIKEELDYTTNKIKEATGITPKLIRPPYGSYNDSVIKYAKDHDDSIILWSVDSLDWKSRNAKAVNDVVQKEITNGAIVLMHDIHQETADALPQLLTALESEGYQFVTVSQLLEWKEENGVGPHFGSIK
ncbi:polysaccharide deacetylase family protein [Bacillus sp. FJAT-49732]|uniref:Polysaccharide deacetylase family protein n=1 Tax=Lederbergia citrisecunda TaxID=2833583 RepID=A0A942TRG6_9BACI|nr:polysaccharide deacetylase family protein [Lederbergia citrisecunda]MBS4202390.1 polysaccharide deacetylase family protein [Lederbergia citrisecunda]